MNPDPLALDYKKSQLAELSDAFADAFRTVDAFSIFVARTDTDIDLEADFGSRPSLKKFTFEFVCTVHASLGCEALDKVVELALALKPGNRLLTKFARSIGLGPIRAAAEMLRKSNFDLRGAEEAWGNILSAPEKQLQVFLLPRRSPEIVASVVERVREYVGKPLAETRTISLAATFKSIELTRQEAVKSLAQDMQAKNVVYQLVVDKDDVDKIDDFLAHLHRSFPGLLTRHCVLLVFAEGAPPLQSRCTLLPKSDFEAGHLYDWVERVSNGKEWPEALKLEFKCWLHAQASANQVFSHDSVYAALDRAIEILKRDLNHGALEAEIKMPERAPPRLP